MSEQELQLSLLYRQACEIELQALKPGNVSVYADGHDMAVADFRLSAEVSAPFLVKRSLSLGEKIYYAIEATRLAVACNTNLGIILLCAPIVEALQRNPDLPLRQGVVHVLRHTTIDDANWVFRAIALAAPGGLGDAKEQDVHTKASVSLTEAMALASDRDRIALQYINNYADIFDFLSYVYYNAWSRWGDHYWAAVTVYVNCLCNFADSHVERKYGSQYNDWIQTKMKQASLALSEADNPTQLIPFFLSIDHELKSKRINPGTTADFTVATAFIVLLESQFCSPN